MFLTPSLLNTSHVGPIHCLRFNTSGDYFFSAGHDKTLCLWNLHQERIVHTYLSHGWEILDVTISNDSTKFVSCGGDKAVFVWDIHQSQPIKRFHGHQHRINAVALNEEGNVVASGSYDATVKLWDMKSNDKSPIQTLTDAKDSITSLSIHGHTLLTASVDGYLRSYDIRIGTLTTDFIGAPITCATYTSDLQCILASSLDQTLRLLDTKDGTILNTFQGHINHQYKLSCTTDATDAWVLSGSEDPGLYTWEIAQSTPSSPTKLTGHDTVILALATQSQAWITGGVDGSICVWR
ncbi:WD repeat-containing protein 83 [Coelomomyces lativittatus]|nr:WD repeat-containing protein 83 [Coelomomyces lativittatus]KAJ1517189.1 WD repeat-containing protein 83 [Coelomomyces lativittatus]KAJ1517834.1 WD repeat-containing protein 83 [Coelomomyces lativittatus]